MLHYFEIITRKKLHIQQSSQLFIHNLFSEGQTKSTNHRQIFREEIHTTNVNTKRNNPRDLSCA